MSPRDSFFNIANLLSLSRLPLGVSFGVVLVAPWGGPVGAVVVLGLAGLTDALDGRYARRAHARRLARGAWDDPSCPSDARARGTTTLVNSAASSDLVRKSVVLDRALGPLESPAGIGSWLDPICDKFFVAMVLGAIWVHSRPQPGLVALILTRELVQLPLSVVYAAVPALRQWLRYDFRASTLGKAATVSQFAAITALLFKSPAAPLASVVTAVLGTLALGDYVGRAIRLGQLRRRTQAEKPRPVFQMSAATASEEARPPSPRG